MGARKMVFFPISMFFPHGPCCIWFPFSDSYVRCMKMMIFTLGLNVHSSACKFNDFVMNNLDNCSFNHFFFFQYTFIKCPSLSWHCRLHSSQYSIDNISLFLRKTNSLMVNNAHKAVIYTYFLKKYK